MKSEKAKKYMDSLSPEVFPKHIGLPEAIKVCEIAEQEAEERFQYELLQYEQHMRDTCSEMMAEQEADITRYRNDLEESKKREELARKVIASQRKEIEQMKALAVEVFKDYMTQKHGGYLSSDLDYLLQKLNER